MLSYMVPVEEKPPPAPGKGRLALELAGAPTPGSPEAAARRAPGKGRLALELAGAPTPGSPEAAARRAPGKGRLALELAGAPTPGSPEAAARRAPGKGRLALELAGAPTPGSPEAAARRAPGKGRLALELAGAPTPGSPEAAARRALKTAISKESSTSSFASDLTISSSTPTGAHDKPKHKLLANGTKHTCLKRVSFGSSKGSMVETLIYESPLQEEPESSPPPKVQETSFPYTPVEDDSERAKVRVSFYQGARPQCLSPPPAPPDTHALYAALLSAAATVDMADHAAYNRQISTESGWDNPFRPDGDLSREADEIVSLIKGGKPITPTPTAAPQLPVCEEEEKEHANNVNANAPSSPLTKVSSPVQQSTPKGMNGTKNGGAGEARGAVEVQRSPPQEPLQPEHVTIKKKPKCKCCVLQ